MTADIAQFTRPRTLANVIEEATNLKAARDKAWDDYWLIRQEHPAGSPACIKKGDVAGELDDRLDVLQEEIDALLERDCGFSWKQLSAVMS